MTFVSIWASSSYVQKPDSMLAFDFVTHYGFPPELDRIGHRMLEEHGSRGRASGGRRVQRGVSQPPVGIPDSPTAGCE
jgi:hypothetical protein